MNRLRTVRDAATGLTTYDYDAAGNLLRVTDAKTQQTQFAYDALNLLTSTTNPLNQVKQFFYDLNRNLAQGLDAKGQTGTFTYDAASQLTGKVLRDTLAEFRGQDTAMLLTTSSPLRSLPAWPASPVSSSPTCRTM